MKTKNRGLRLVLATAKTCVALLIATQLAEPAAAENPPAEPPPGNEQTCEQSNEINGIVLMLAILGDNNLVMQNNCIWNQCDTAGGAARMQDYQLESQVAVQGGQTQGGEDNLSNKTDTQAACDIDNNIGEAVPGPPGN